MRRVLVILLLLAIVAAAAYTLLRWNRVAGVAADPWIAIPERAAVIMEVPDAWVTWDHFTHTSQFWSTVEHLPQLAAVGRLMAQTTARAENDEALRAALKDVTMLAALMRTGNEQVDLLLTCAPHATDGVPAHAFAELLKMDDAVLHTLQQGGTVQCRPDTALPALSVAVREGVWLLATSPAMMDEALLQVKNGKRISADPLLKDAIGTLGGGADAHVLVHLERARNLLHTWFLPARIDDLDLPTGWAALDLRARPDALLLSGLIIPASPHETLTVMEQQGTGRTELGRWLPADVAAWDVRQVSDGEAFLRELGVASDSTISTLGPSLFNWVHGNIGLAHTADSTGAARSWALFQTADPEGAALEIRKQCPDGLHCDTLNHRGIRMTRLPVARAYERLLGPAYAPFGEGWWSSLSDVVVLAPRPEDLRSAIDAWYDGRTLAEDARTNAWTERIASTAGRTMRWDIARYWRQFMPDLKPDAAKAYASEQHIWQAFGGLAIQLSPAQHGRTHIAIGLEHAPVTQRNSGVHWSTPLPPGTTRKPDILRNHTNNTREVLVQDGEHRIHLIGSSGKVLWKYELDGPILGQVHQVDRFKNGKLQLLFNTAGRIHLIDRNGKDVGGFPLTLPAKASAPIAVFDYENSKEYRVLVPVEDGRILNYGMDGAPTTGWEAPRLASSAENELHHLRIKNKDYLLAFDGAGKVNVYDRRGAERERATLNMHTGAKVLNVSPGLDIGATRILWADSTGALYEGNLNGTAQAIAALGANTLGTLADDGLFDIIRTTGDSLIVLHGTKEVWSRTFGTALGPDVHTYQHQGRTLIGVVLPEREQIVLLDDGGRPLDDMPLRGNTAFSIADLDLDGSMELITVTADGHVIDYKGNLAP